jgi:translocation and assembly module TamA
VILLLFFTLSYAKTYDKLTFEGEGIDFLVGDFSTSTLYKVIGKPYPPFYTPWRDDPTFEESEIEEYKKRLLEYFHSLGYYKAEIEIEPNENEIVVNIKKNAPIRVTSITIAPAKELKKGILFKVGDIFNTSTFSATKKGLERYLQEEGYPKYAFDAKAYVDVDAYEVALDFHVDKNGSYSLGSTIIEGRGDVDEEIIKEAIVYKKGDTYDIRKLEKTYDNIYELGVYDYILVDPKLDGNSSEIPIKIDLKMGETKFLKGSIGYNTDEGARGGISWTDKNFMGNLKVFDVGIKATQVGYEAYNIFYNPRIILPYIGKITFENDINYRKYRYDTFDETTLQNRITLGKRAYGLEHYFGMLTEYSKIDAKVDSAVNESGNYFLNSLFYRFLIDKRDSMIDARNGYYIALYLEKSMRAIGSDLDYFKSILELRYIKSYGSRWTFGAKTRIGMINEDVPIFKRFFTGGSTTNRGYEYRDLGPKDSASIPLGGVSLVDVMLEARYRLWQKLWMVTFYDTSMLSLKPHTFDEHFYGSYGMGVRYLTPIGPFRLDFGFPEDRDGFSFHISIGQVF